MKNRDPSLTEIVQNSLLRPGILAGSLRFEPIGRDCRCEATSVCCRFESEENPAKPSDLLLEAVNSANPANR